MIINEYKLKISEIKKEKGWGDSFGDIVIKLLGFHYIYDLVVGRNLIILMKS